MGVRAIAQRDRARVNALLKEAWDAPPVVSRGRVIDTAALPGFVWGEGDAILGVVTYRVEGDGCEIVTLNSFQKSRGIGTALVEAVLKTAKEKGCAKLWLVTTNDAVDAIRFYQKRGFDLIAAHINAVDISRALKPSIPLLGQAGIPIKHELEFAIQL